MGIAGNDYLPGQINHSERQLNSGLTVSNINETSGGDDEETTPALRERMMLAPESYSNAGSYGAYKFHALSVHQSITDVVVLGPGLDDRIPPGQVWIYPLTKNGLPSEELLQLIESKISSEKKRPINDLVFAKSPEKIEYEIDARLTLYRSADAPTTLSSAESTISDWVMVKSSLLGGDIVPHQISKTLSVPGVYDITLNTPEKLIIKPYQWPVCININVSLAGISDE